MNHFKRIFCLVLAAVFALTLAGCDKGGNPSSVISSVLEEVSSADDVSSEDSSSVVSRYDYYNDMNNLKPLDGVVDSRPDYTSNNVQTTVVFDWPGPYGYVIVTPAGNLKAYNSAVLLQTYFKNIYGETLEIVTDSNADTGREILVGKTNRSESDKNLRDSDLKVSVKGDKLVFDGGHDVTVDLAVKKFLKLAPSTRGVCTFSESTDFTSTKDGGYTYVWGDEFEVDGLDRNKWSDQSSKMGDGGVVKLVSNSNTLSVKDGAMKLTAYKDSYGVYYVPPSVHTQSTMNFKYGYVEMRAKLSLEVGSFASFWTRSISDNPKAAVAPSMQLDHFFEVDMFEVFQRKGNQSIGGNILINSNIKSKNWYPTAMPYTQQLVIPNEEYHLFGYEWTPTEIKLYFDNKMYARFDMSTPWTGTRTNGKGIAGWDQELRPDNTGTNLVSFQEHQYLIFNHHLHIAVDDGKGGKKGFLASTSVTENTNFQKADYVIDYVRLYQQSGQSVYVK